ncbi:MAG: hypothetical protein WDO74_26050 [Pseudomonadota bacterium]
MTLARKAISIWLACAATYACSKVQNEPDGSATAGSGGAPADGNTDGGAAGENTAGGASAGAAGESAAGAAGESAAGAAGNAGSSAAGGEAGGMDATAGAQESLANDFSATVNPPAIGHFSYGWKPARTGTFTLYQTLVQFSGLPAWARTTDLIPGCTGNPAPPLLWKNIHHETFSPCTSNAKLIMPADSVASHPGPNGENSVARWTSPAPGKYQIVATFSAIDETTTDVAIVRNDASPELFVGAVSTAANATFDGTLELASGETLDFCVGFGTNGNYFSDSTGIAVTIKPQ